MYKLVDSEKVQELEKAFASVWVHMDCMHYLPLAGQLDELRTLPLITAQCRLVDQKLLDMPVVIEFDGTSFHNKVYVKSPAGWADVTSALQEDLCNLTMGMIPIDPADAADFLTGHRNSFYTLQALAAIRPG